MDAFAQAVTGWHDFYHVIGDAAAALMGLLFVSLSLNADLILRRKNADLRGLAAQTFTNFMLVLMFAVVMLIPDQGPRGLGIPLLCIAAIGLYATFRRLLQTIRSRRRRWGAGGLALRFAIPAICFVTVMIVAVLALLRKTDGLYWLVPVMILLIWYASLNALDLLLRLREPKKES